MIALSRSTKNAFEVSMVEHCALHSGPKNATLLETAP